MRNQSYAQEIEQMNQRIQGRERIKQETITRIQQERKNRETAFRRELEQQKQLQEQIIIKQSKINEEKLNHDKLASESKITSSSQEKINRLNRELTEMKQKLEDQIRQSQVRRDISQQN